MAYEILLLKHVKRCHAPRPEGAVQISENAYSGVKRPPNVGAAISASKMGKPRSPETIAKMRAANLGKKQSPETIAKRAAALRGRKRGPTGKPSWNRGKKTPLDVRLKQSVAARHRQSQHIPQQAYLSSEWVN